MFFAILTVVIYYNLNLLQDWKISFMAMLCIKVSEFCSLYNTKEMSASGSTIINKTLFT